MRIDPRLEILYLIGLGSALFLIPGPEFVCGALILQLLLYWRSALPWRDLGRMLRKLALLLAIILVSYAFLGEGLLAGALMCGRIVALIWASLLVARTGAPTDLVHGLQGLGMPRVAALALDLTLTLIADAPAGRGMGGGGGGGGGGRGGGRGGTGAEPAAEPGFRGMIAGIRSIAGGDATPILAPLRAKLAQAEARAAQVAPDLSPAAAGDLAIIAALAAFSQTVRFAKLLPGLPFAPGHKAVLLLPLYVVAADRTRMPLGATALGLTLGIVSFSLGDGGHLGPFVILKFLAPGILIDLLWPLARKGGGPVYALVGLAAAIAQLAAVAAVGLLVRAPASYFAAFIPMAALHSVFGCASGYVTFHLLRALGPRAEQPLGATGIGIVLLLLAGPALVAACGPETAAVQHVARPAGHELANPPVLPDKNPDPRVVEVDLAAGAHEVTAPSGEKGIVYAYNGAAPGPTLEVTEGQRVIVHYRNELPEPSNVHWHGLHVPPEQDGLPHDMVAEGATRDYVFDIPTDTAGSYWYHPHPHGMTGWQVAKGLWGAIVVKPVADPVPAGIRDLLVMLSDMPLDGTEAADEETEKVLVTGHARPKIRVRPGETVRLRLYNVSPARHYRLAIPGLEWRQIGSDGGLLERPVDQVEVLLAPAERIDTLVTFPGAAGSRTAIVARYFDRGEDRPRLMDDPDPAPGSEEGDVSLVDVLSFGAPIAGPPPTLPQKLRTIPPISAKGALERQVRLFRKNIDGMSYDMERVDMIAKRGTVEIWTVHNRSPLDHPFHLHGYQFQVLDRDGVAEPFRAWKDTFRVASRETVRFIVKFDGFPGLRLYHCHILPHEDDGMMGNLLVEP